MAVTAFASDPITEVIPVTYLSTGDAVQALRPLLKEGESVTPSGHQLILTASPETLLTVKNVLHQIDLAPATFAVLVHQDQANWLSQQANNDVTYSTDSEINEGDSQSIQVSSGESAFISTGSNVPVLSSAGAGLWGPGVNYQREQISQGILFSPELQGQRVKLKMRRVNAQMDQVNNQNINQQQLNTTTLIPLNQWVKLGSAGQADTPSDDSDEVTYSAGAKLQEKATLYIKVMVIPR